MRRLYLIRHGAPDFPNGEKHCLGLCDMPLGALGRMQAVILSKALEERSFSAVYCSRLSRAVQTAEYLSPAPIVLEGLEEMSAGEWDGLSFRQIRAGWPELFAQRGANCALPIPGSENVDEGQRRFLSAVNRAVAESTGDIAIVAHSTVNQSLLCHIRCVPAELGRQFKLPYCSYCVIDCDGDLKLLSDAAAPQPEVDEALCEKLLTAAKTPEHVRRHCRAVAREAVRIARELLGAGARIDVTTVENAALLHDIARTEPNHADIGAEWLAELGLSPLADIVRRHHDLGEFKPDATAVVYIADKLVREDTVVTLSERFAASREKCRDEQALLAHDERYKTALAVRDMINTFCGKEVIL